MENETPAPGSTSKSSNRPTVDRRTRFEIAKGLCDDDDQFLAYFVGVTFAEVVHRYPAFLPFVGMAKRAVLDHWRERPLVAASK